MQRVTRSQDSHPVDVKLAVELTLLVALLVFIGCKPAGISSEWERVEPPRAAADFTLPQLNGDPVSLSALRGRPVVMEFWATWCAPCRYSTPSLEAVYRRYQDRGVVVLLVNQGESAEQIRAWSGKRFTAPMLLDHDGAVAGRYGVVGIPRLFILDRDGHIIFDHSGYAGGLERNLHVILDHLLTHAAHG